METTENWWENSKTKSFSCYFPGGVKNKTKKFLPCQVSEVGVYRAANNLAANVTELFYSVAESNDLSGTHKCEIQGVEEEDQVLSWRNYNQ